MVLTKRAMAQKENKLSKIDKTILDNFYKLVHTDQNVRLRAALSTYKILTAMKKSKPNAFNEHLNYCIERLVTGLASSRALARRGYATLLLEILKNHQVSSERLFTIAQQKFGNISNETSADNLLGYFLLITVVIDSGNHKRGKQSANISEKMFKQLMQIRNLKSYFDYPVSKLLTDHHEMFHSCLLANVSHESLGAGNKITHPELLTLVLCNKKVPMREFTRLDSAAIANLSNCLSSDRLQRRPLHPVWIEYSKLLILHMPQHFESFYDQILMPTFFKPNHNELATMGLELIVKLLEETDDPNLIRIILSDYVIRLLILSQRSRSSLQKHCVEFFKTLSGYFQSSLKGDVADEGETDVDKRQFSILNRLTTSPGSVAFDEDSKSTSISGLLNSCRPNVLIKYLDKLLAILNKSFPAEEQKRLHAACARQISHVMHRPQMMDHHEAVQRLAKFLIVNSLFVRVTLKSNKESNFWSANNIPAAMHHLDASTRIALKSTYHSAMDHLTSTCNTLQRKESFEHLVDFTDQLLKCTTVEPCEENAKLEELWPAYYQHLSAHRKLVKKHQDSKLLYPISNLYLFYGFQILEHGLDCNAQLDELVQSAQEALKNDPNDGSWADVLTDQIIAILSATECSPWIRKLCVSVFGSLLPHISETSIDLICEALNAPLGDDECDDEEESDGMDSDEEADSDDESDEEEEEEDAEMDHQSAIEEIADEDEVSNEEIGDNQDRMEVESGDDEDQQESDNDEEEVNHDVDKEASDEEEEGEEDDEEYLDDEQMMKLDTVLADMFRLNRIGKKRKRDPSFQLRVLDLVKKVLAKKKNDTEVVKKVLAAVGPLADKTRKLPELRPISEKITKMIAKVPGRKALAASKQQTTTQTTANDESE